MVGDRPVDLVTFSQQYHHTPNCTVEGLTQVFCSQQNQSSELHCEEYFSRITKSIKRWKGKQPAIGERVSCSCYFEFSLNRLSIIFAESFYFLFTISNELQFFPFINFF